LEKKREAVVREIFSIIREGNLFDGNKLPPERELAARFGVSRVILREAIVALETLGVLETKKRLGIFVREPELGQVSESLRLMPFWPEKFVPHFLEVRLIIDVNAAELAALRRTDLQLGEMKKCLDILKSICIRTKEDMRMHAHYEYLFHTLVIEAAQNPILSKIWEGLASLVEKNNELLHEELTQDEEWAPLLASQHEAILDAIERKNPVVAACGMRNHLLEVRNRYSA